MQSGPPAISTYVSGYTAPFAPVDLDRPEAGIGFQTSQGSQHVPPAPGFGSPLSRYQQQMAGPPSANSWQRSSSQHTSGEVDDSQNGTEEMLLNSSPSNANQSRSQSAEAITRSHNNPQEQEPSFDPKPLKGDPRYKNGGSRSASHMRDRQPKSRVSTRKGKLNPETRAKAAEMRRNGRCIRCIMYKLGVSTFLSPIASLLMRLQCDGDGTKPCSKCMKVENSARSFLEPCTRADLKETSLVRQCTYSLTFFATL